MQPIAGEIVVTVTSNVIKITAVIMVGYAVMEVIRGLINMSTWLFELPMPAVFKASLKSKKQNVKGSDD